MASNSHMELAESQSEQTQEDIRESLRLIEDLKFFLATAPANWQENQVIRRYYLNHDEGFVSCVFWNNLYFITGTDIVRCIVYKLQHFGRKIVDRKKFEEGIFSDLRNLKCGVDAILEPPKSEFLEFLFKNSCLRTQKKQKVFFWFNVPHDKLMADALERDLKKELLGQNPTTIAHKEPAISFKYDENKFLFNQLVEHMDKQKTLTKTPLDNSSLEDNSPEYMTTTSQLQNIQTDTEPSQSSHVKEEPAYEDDFPLDYFNPEGSMYRKSNDYISLDTSVQPQYADTLGEYDDYLDSSQYLIPTPSANELVHNEEYLIEQTQPLKTPIAPISSTYQTKPAKFPVTRIPSSNEEYFPHSLPSATPRPATFYNDASLYKPLQLSSLYHPDYNYFEPEYWQPEPFYEPMPLYGSQVNYMLMDEEAGFAHSPFLAVSPSVVNIPPYYGNHTPAALQFTPSSRQQAISANMMKKRSQLNLQKQQRDRVSKPDSNYASRHSNPRNLHTDQIFNNFPSKTTRVVNFKGPKNETGSGEENETLIPTPESSIANSEQVNNHHTGPN